MKSSLHLCQLICFPIIFILSTNPLTGQDLSVYIPLANKTWETEGYWGDSTLFKQEITFTFSLDSQIVIAQSNGFTDEDRSHFGPRNHGIRRFNPELGKIEFWEFDVFGGLTTGMVLVDGLNHYYQYVYGDNLITDGWERLDNETYIFKVGIFEDGKWRQLYLQTYFRLKKSN